MEQWKSITGYEGLYEVSNLGRVKSIARIILYKDDRECKYPEKVLSHDICKTNDAHMVHLYSNSKRKALIVHRLVAEAFISNPDNKSDVNHIDGDRHNNVVSNLEWATRLENMQHGFKTGLINNTGINHGNNVYSEDQIRAVKKMLKDGIASSTISTQTGVKKATISQIIRGKQWTHL